MANRNQVTGRAKVTIDGALLKTAGETTLDIGGVKREAVEGDYSAGSFRQSGVQPSKLEVSILDTADFDPVAFGNIDNSTVLVAFDNGKSYVIRNAYAEGPPPAATSDGKAKGVLMGPPAERVK